MDKTKIDASVSSCHDICELQNSQKRHLIQLISVIFNEKFN